ncbi:exo-beta-N-acetylmuramidase NamZ domain-containing protein, partial [Undibacterium luofuense]
MDTQTGLPVYSLYGPRLAPTPEMLKQIDLVVVDLQ